MRLRGIVGTLTILGGWSVADLVAVATSLGSSLDIVLNLLLLLFVGVPYLNSLANLSLLGSI
mgnify:CR=1 FL=1